VDESDLQSFLNPRSPRYRDLDLEDRALTKKEAIDLVLEDPNLMRRPLVLKGKKHVFGWDPDEYERMLA
jgi:arsenate reductase-like glutaredoxin family protein